MAKFSIAKGSTSVLTRIFIQDSTSTAGVGKAGLTASSFTGTAMFVCRDDDGNAGATSVSLTNSTRGTWSSGGIKEKDSSNAPGIYELGLTNASLASGSRSTTYFLNGTGFAPVVLEIELTGWDNQLGSISSVTGSVNSVVSSVVASSVTGSVGSVVGGAASVTGSVGSVLGGVGSVTGSVGSVLGGAASVTGSVGSVLGGVGSVTGSVGSVLGGVGSVTGSVGSVLGGVGSVTGSVGSVVAGVTVTTNNDKTGYSLTVTPPTAATIATTLWQDSTSSGDFTTTGSIGKLLSTDIDAAISSRSTFSGGAVASVTGGVGSVTGSVGSVLGGVGSVTGSVGSVVAGVTVTTNNDKTGYTVNSVTGSVGSVVAGVTVTTNNDKTGYTANSVTGSVGSVVGGVGSVTGSVGSVLGSVAGSVTGSVGSILSPGSVWDVVLAPAHTTTGTAGGYLIASGSAADPWLTALPGGYTAGMAGYIIGHNMDAAVSSRSTFAGGAVASVTSGVTVTTNNDKMGYSLVGPVTLAANGLDAIVVEAGLNARQALSIIASSSAGVLSGVGTGTIIISGAGVATNRLTSSVSGGNRLTVTLNPPP